MPENPTPANADQNITLNVDGKDVQVEKLNFTVYRIGGQKDLLQLPADMTWEQVAELLGGAGKTVIAPSGEPASSLGSTTIGSTPAAERRANVGVSRGVAGI